MMEKTKLHRDEQSGKKAAKSAHAQAEPAAKSAKAPDLPELGKAATPALGGGGGAGAAAKADQSPGAVAEQQKELARIKSLPAGSPELEQYKKPEAKAAKLPEGAGATSAKSQAKSAAPENKSQPAAKLGEPAQKVSKEPAGKGLEAKKEPLKQAQASGPSAKALQIAGKTPAKGAAVAEKAAVHAEKVAAKEPAKVAADKKSAPAGKELNTKGESKSAPAAKGEGSVGKSPVGQSTSAKGGDPGAGAKSEGKSGKAPVFTPEKLAVTPAKAAPVAVQKVPADAKAAGAKGKSADAAASKGADSKGATDASGAKAAAKQAVSQAAAKQGAAKAQGAAKVQDGKTAAKAATAQAKDSKARSSVPDPTGAAAKKAADSDDALEVDVDIDLSAEVDLDQDGQGAAAEDKSSADSDRGPDADGDSSDGDTDVSLDAEVDAELEVDADDAPEGAGSSRKDRGKRSGSGLDLEAAAELDVDIDLDALRAGGEIDLEAAAEIDIEVGDFGTGKLADLRAQAKAGVDIDGLLETAKQGVAQAGEDAADLEVDVEVDLDIEIETDDGDRVHLNASDFVDDPDSLEKIALEDEPEAPAKDKGKGKGGSPAAHAGGGGGGGTHAPAHGGGGGGGGGGGSTAPTHGGGGGGGTQQTPAAPQQSPGQTTPAHNGGGGGGGGTPAPQRTTPQPAPGRQTPAQQTPAQQAPAQQTPQQRTPSRPSGGGGGSIDQGHVNLSFGGQLVVVQLPQMDKGTTQKTVPVRNPGVRGFAIAGSASLNFSTDGRFEGGTVTGSVAVAGGVMAAGGVQVNIGAQGQMTSAFAGVALQAGPVSGVVTATAGPDGMSGHGEIQYSQVRAGRLAQWLSSGSLTVDVDSAGNVSGSGQLGVTIPPFSAGTVAAQFANRQLSGQVEIHNTQAIQLGNNVTLTDGSLSGTLAENDKVSVAGQLDLAIGVLGTGKGQVQGKWDSTTNQINGSATYTAGPASLGPVVFKDSKVTGTVTGGALTKVDGSGNLSYSDVVEGKWLGSVDLQNSAASFQLDGKLSRPIVQGDASIESGQIQAKVDSNALTSLTGSAAFKYASFLEGTATLDEGSSLTQINATASAHLIAPQQFGDVTLTDGSMTVKVRGTQVELVSGTVSMQYKDIAKGTLNLSASADLRKFSGHAHAELIQGQTWGQLDITGGNLDLDFDNGGIKNASGDASFKYGGFVEGKLGFTGLQELPLVSGEATAHISAEKPLAGKLKLLPDAGRSLDLKVERSAFKSFTGSVAWQWDKIGGDLSVNVPSTDFSQITGEGHADLLEQWPIGSSGLAALPGSSLTAKVQAGQLTSFSGNLLWKYQQWLGGNIALLDSNVEHLQGQATANVLQPHEVAPQISLESGSASLTFDSQRAITDQPLEANFGWKYQTWLAGDMAVSGPGLAKLMGTASAQVIANKSFGDVTIHQGSSLTAAIKNTAPDSFGGVLDADYQKWLGGHVEIQEGSKLDEITGKATVSVLADHPLGGKITLVQGGSITANVQASQLTTFGGTALFKYDTFLDGSLTIDEGSTTKNVSGSGTLSLTQDYAVKGTELSLLQGSTGTVKVSNNNLDSVSGHLGWRYQKWVEGSIDVQASKLEDISGHAEAHIVDNKDLIGGFKFLPGGSAQVDIKNSALTTFGGSINWGYKDLVTGNLTVDTGSTTQSISGTGHADLIRDFDVPGTELTILQGASADAVVKSNAIDTISGHIPWRYQKWAEGSVDVSAAKLTQISGHADAHVVENKDLTAGLKLLPGGHLEAEVAANQLKSFGGTVNWGYKDWLDGDLTLETTQTLSDISGSGHFRLLKDFPLGDSGAKILSGSAAEVKLAHNAFESLSGSVDFQYKNWLKGNITLKDSTLQSFNGHATASIIDKYAPGNGPFYLQEGGQIDTDFAASTFTDIEGHVEFGYADARLKLAGNAQIEKSPINSLTGSAQAHLTAPTASVADTKLLEGGSLSLKVVGSRPESFGGHVDWLHNTWLGGSVELPEGTPVAGPYKGHASASIKTNKNFGGKFSLLEGGHVELDFDTGSPVEQQKISGEVAVDYDHWLKGTLTVNEGSTFAQPSGKAVVQVTAPKEFGLIKIEPGGQADVTFVGTEITGISGHVDAIYDSWLKGSIVVDDGSTLQAIQGKAGLTVVQPKSFGDIKLLLGGNINVKIANSLPVSFGGDVDWMYQEWVKGNLTAKADSTFDSITGSGSATIVQPKELGHEVKLLTGGNAKVTVAASAVKKFSGDLNIQYQDWVKGGISLSGESDLSTVTGHAQVSVFANKDLPGQVTLKTGSQAEADFTASEIKKVSGTLNFSWADTVEGKLELAAGSNLQKVSGHAHVGLMKEIPLAGGVVLQKGGSVEADFDGQKVTRVSGTISLGYQEWLKGTITATTGSTLDQVSGKATLQVVAPKKFGIIEIQQGSSLEVDITNNKATNYKGNVDVKYEDWLKGAIKFSATDLASISGQGSMSVFTDHTLVSPVSLLKGSSLTVNFEKSALKDFGGNAQLGVEGWGKGGVTVNDGSTPKDVSGQGNLTLTAPKPMGQWVTLTHGELGASVEHNAVKAIWGRLDGDIKSFGTGWVQIDKASTLTNFTGQAGLKLTTPQRIGSFAELSGGLMIANFQDNALKDFGGQVDIKVMGWGKGTVQVEQGSTLEYIKGSATIELTERKELAGGKLFITGGNATAKVDGQRLTEVGGMIEVQLAQVAKGRIQGTLDVEKQSFSGSGTVQQLAPWKAGPVTVSNGRLQANVNDNKVVSASGSAEIDAGRIGKGTFQVNYEDAAEGPLFYGSGTVAFKPHDRVDGSITVNYTREKKLTGEGNVTVKISDKITGRASVALDEQGHVKLKGSVTVPGPFELFKPPSYKKDLTLLDTGFVVYTPPTVKVKVGAGLGIECGIKPLTISNITIGGEVDLMEPSFANMSVSGHMSSSAYCDLNAYVQGSVQVSAAVVAVEAGLRASLNLHLEAALSADPTITVNRNGLSFDMPVDARLTAALNLILTFFAKVRVGLDVGIFSIMKTVWEYDKSPDPIRLAEMSIGAKGNVHAGPDGFRGTMTPEYQPPDFSLESLKRALHIG